MSLSLENVAIIYGVFMSVAPLFQVRKMLQRRSADDVSLIYLLVLVIGFCLYLTYGFSISNRLLIITNIVSIISMSTTIFVALLISRRMTPAES